MESRRPGQGGIGSESETKGSRNARRGKLIIDKAINLWNALRSGSVMPTSPGPRRESSFDWSYVPTVPRCSVCADRLTIAEKMPLEPLIIRRLENLHRSG